MIKIFYGDDRVKAGQEINRLLGQDHEVFDGDSLIPSDLPNIFYGTSLLAADRHILIRDFTANKMIYEQLATYIDTPHTIIMLETKLDKRSATYKALKDKLEFKEFKLPEERSQFYSFDICRTAKRDGQKAVQMLREIEPTSDPMLFFGALASVVLKDYATHQGIKERGTLKALAALDLKLKSTKINPWLLIESFLLEMPSI